MMNHQQSAYLRLFTVLVAVAYMWGVLSVQHYIPSSMDFYVNAQVVGILALAAVIGLAGYWSNATAKTTLLWALLSLLLLCQPLLNSIVYVDALLFPVACVVLCCLLASVVNRFSVREKVFFCQGMAWALLCAGVLTVMSQLVQLFAIDELLGFWVFKSDDNSLIGNIAQVNQAAFASILGMAAALYLFFSHAHRQYWRWAYFLVLCVLGMGVGLSISRGALLMAVAVMGLGFCYRAPNLWLRFVYCIVIGAVLWLGYQIGTELLLAVKTSSTTAVSRMVGENSLLFRKYLLEEAWLAFSQNWLTGIGWGNFKQFGLSHAESITWFTVADHSHNVFAQIAAELGVLGLAILCGFIWLLLRQIRLDMPTHHYFAYSVLVLLGMYSLSEYPLWFMRFLLLAAVFVAVIDEHFVQIVRVPRWLVVVLSVFLLLGSIFYVKQYGIYRDVAYMVQDDRPTDEEKMQALQNTPPVFGFSEYKELMFFILQPPNMEYLSSHIQVGERVLAKYLDVSLMMKQANLLVLAGESDEADKLFRASCLFDRKAECDNVAKFLQTAAA
ncbi:O-antigen ligase, partial [Neisseria sp. HSC-16F19]